MKILIIRFSSIGDIVLTTPIIRCLKKQVPHAEVHYLTKAGNIDWLQHNIYIDKLFALEGDLQPVVLELLKESYDVVIDLHHNLRSRFVKSMLKQQYNSRVQCFSVNKLNVRKWLRVHTPINKLPDRSIVDRYFDTVKTLGVTNDGAGMDFFIPESARITDKDIPTSHSLGYAAFVIGGQHATKKMPVSQWQRLCRDVNLPVILLGGPEDAAAAQEIAAIDPIKIYVSCGKFSLLESADLVRRARFVVSHDTGLMHIAAAFQKPILSIWGNTVPDFGMFPYYGHNNLVAYPDPRSVLIENKSLSCRPCSKIGYTACPKKHFKCMNELPLDKAVSQANEWALTK